MHTDAPNHKPDRRADNLHTRIFQYFVKNGKEKDDFFCDLFLGKGNQRQKQEKIDRPLMPSSSCATVHMQVILLPPLCTAPLAPQVADRSLHACNRFRLLAARQII
jgi:hypothetical protein